jgi:prephenate dehydrogenase
MTDLAPQSESRALDRVPHRVEVIGLGLIGASIARRLKQLGWYVTGNDIDTSRSTRAQELGIIDSCGVDRSAPIVILATPASCVVDLARSLLQDSSRNGVIVTDVAGVKAKIVAGVNHDRFVGGHPMAGSEQEGPDGSDSELFNGATWVLTPSNATDPDAFQAVRDLVTLLGADVLSLAPDRHDALVAVVSHLPHLTAANLMAVAADASTEHAALLRLAAGGFRDMTRIAAGDPSIWPDIFRDNSQAILVALDALRERLDEARRIVATDDRRALIDLLDYAKQARRNLPARVPLPEALAECRIPVPDRPGVLAEVTTVLGELGVNIWDLEIAHSAEGDRGVLVLAISEDVADQARVALIARGYHPSIGSLA